MTLMCSVFVVVLQRLCVTPARLVDTITFIRPTRITTLPKYRDFLTIFCIFANDLGFFRHGNVTSTL